MCIRVHYVSSGTASPWDPERRLIRIPAQLEGIYALRAVRKVLSELAVEQPELGARCFCGERVRLLAQVSQQRVNGDQVVIHHGA